MIKIDLNKVCCFSLLFANLYSPSGLLCYFLVASPIERRSRLAIENIEKAIYEVIVPLPHHSSFVRVSFKLAQHFFVPDFCTLLCYGFLSTLTFLCLLYTTHQLLCVNFSASVVLWLEEYINSNIPLRSQIQVANY